MRPVFPLYVPVRWRTGRVLTSRRVAFVELAGVSVSEPAPGRWRLLASSATFGASRVDAPVEVWVDTTSLPTRRLDRTARRVAARLAAGARPTVRLVDGRFEIDDPARAAARG